MLRGLQFEPWVAPVQHWRNRMDVACFVGYTRRRAGNRVPRSILQWLRQYGWIDAPGQRSSVTAIDGTEEIVGGLDHLPLPIDDWSMFERLFDVRSAPVSAEVATRVPGYLAAAVRSFFAQGGRRCIVVPIEHPEGLFLRAAADVRIAAIGALLPDRVGDVAAMEPSDRSVWRGIGVLHGLDDVATVCLPDLPWLVGRVPEWLTPDESPVIPRDRFFECADPIAPRPEVVRQAPLAIGRCDEPEYRAWAAAVRSAVRFLGLRRRDVAFVAALPLPTPDSDAHRDPIAALLSWGLLAPADEGSGASSDEGIASRFLQLVYPWIGWSGSRGMPEALEPPDGAVTGMLARGILVSGAYRSVAGLELYEIDRFEPKLSRDQREREPVTATPTPHESALVDRISLVGPAPQRFELLSDVTTAVDAVYQIASIQRLHAVWIRALRQAGELFVFEANNEQLWSSVRRQLEQVGLALYRNGALRGENAMQAFSVRCDRTTMGQRDLDSGRLIAEIRYRPTAPLELIRISLALSENRDVTVVGESVEVSA